MPLHPQCKSFLDILASAGGTPLEQLPVEEARQGTGGLIAFGGPEVQIARVTNHAIPGPGRPLRLRVYSPSLDSRLPAVMFFHGGGFVLGDLESHDRQCRQLANASDCVVIAVDYRLAPEHRFPAAAEDAYAATRYVAEHASEFGIDSTRLAVAGDSAGGNLATVAALMARDAGGPALRFQLLIYPVVDFNDESPSMQEYANDHFITRNLLDWFAAQYVPNEADRTTAWASPINADLHGLPPALVITSECDPLRDQGEAYARKLQAAGVATALKRYDGMIHPFLSLAGIVDEGRTAMDDAGAALRQALEAVPVQA